MGRMGGGGGSHGGGGHGGGGFSGSHHSGGGFSGGGRSGGGRMGGGRSGSGRMGGGPRGGMGGGFGGPSGGPRGGMGGPGFGPGPGGPRPPRGPYGPGPGPRPPRGPYGYGPRPHRGGGCGTYLITFVIVLFLISAITSHGLYRSSSDIVTTYSNAANVQSTVERTKLDSDNLVLTDYYTDDAGIIYDSSELESGMKTFYQKTGVQPYLYITQDVDGDTTPDDSALEAKAEELYSELFSDECHYLLLFVANVDLEDAGEDYLGYSVIGHEAATVIDDEADTIIASYIQSNYYNSNLDWEQVFSNAFRDAGTSIMTVYTSPMVYIVVIAGVVAVVFIGYKWWGKKRQAKKEEEEQTEKILNTPLEKYSDPASDLAKKYDSKDTDNSQETTD